MLGVIYYLITIMTEMNFLIIITLMKDNGMIIQEELFMVERLINNLVSLQKVNIINIGIVNGMISNLVLTI